MGNQNSIKGHEIAPKCLPENKSPKRSWLEVRIDLGNEGVAQDDLRAPFVVRRLHLCVEVNRIICAVPSSPIGRLRQQNETVGPASSKPGPPISLHLLRFSVRFAGTSHSLWTRARRFNLFGLAENTDLLLKRSSSG